MKILLYTEMDCPDCVELKKGLKENNIEFENKDLNEKSDNKVKIKAAVRCKVKLIP